MNHPLAGALAKLHRAEAQSQALAAEIRTFINSSAYSMDQERNAQRFEHRPFNIAELRALGLTDDIPGLVWTGPDTCEVPVFLSEVTVLRARVHKPLPSLDWGVLIGEIVHDLRSALDCLAWELTVDNQGYIPRLPLPFNSDWRRVMFPIVVEPPPAWTKAHPRRLWGINQSLVARFEQLQPFQGGQKPGTDPQRHPLAVLEELWNGDKHRAVHLVGSGVAVIHVSSRSDAVYPGAPQLQAKLIEGGDWRPLEDGTELGKVEISNPVPDPRAHSVHVNMDIRGLFDVAFDDGPPAYGGRVSKTLNQIGNYVADILASFENDFPRWSSHVASPAPAG